MAAFGDHIVSVAEARNATHASSVHPIPDRSSVAMGLLLDDSVMPLGAQGILFQALELFMEAKLAAEKQRNEDALSSSTAAEETTSGTATDGNVIVQDNSDGRSAGLSLVHAALDRLVALHRSQRDAIQKHRQST